MKPQLTAEEIERKRLKNIQGKLIRLFEQRSGHIANIKRSVTALAKIDPKIRRYKSILEKAKMEFTDEQARKLIDHILQQV